MINPTVAKVSKIQQLGSSVTGTTDQDTTTRITTIVVETVLYGKQQKYLADFTVNINLPVNFYTPFGLTIAH